MMWSFDTVKKNCRAESIRTGGIQLIVRILSLNCSLDYCCYFGMINETGFKCTIQYDKWFYAACVS